MEKDFIIEAESVKEPEKREHIRLSEEKIADLKRIIANLGSDIDELSLKKDLLIVENNKLRGLLKDIKLFFEECNPHDFTVVADNMDVYLTHINEVLK